MKERREKIFKFLFGTSKLAAAIAAVWIAWVAFADNVGYRPDQPISFSHKTHSEKFGIKCVYCHRAAEKAPNSSLPTTSDCMVCHVALNIESDLLAVVNESYDEGVPIRWNRVYRLPDHARFSHEAHLLVGIDCSSCHGEVERIDSAVFQDRALTMNFCLDCHRDPGGAIVPARDISGIFTTFNIPGEYKIEKPIPFVEPIYGAWRRELNKQEIENVPTPQFPTRGSENCTACHR